MKATLLLALPAIALAAATPPSVEQRQLPDLDLPLDVQCLQRVANIDRCLPNLGSGSTPVVSDLVGCITTAPLVVFNALSCIDTPIKA